MDKKKAMVWVKALRSGKFKQGTGNLKQIDENGKATYCCLGVLGEINGCDLEEFNYTAILSSLEVQKACGIESEEGYPSNDENGDPVSVKVRVKGNDYVEFENLADANDSGVSFKSIATWIEKNYKLL